MTGFGIINLPHRMLRTALVERMSDAEIEDFTMFGSSLDGVQVRFPNVPDTVVKVSGFDGDDIFKNYRRNRGLVNLYVPNIYVSAYSGPDEDIEDVILKRDFEATFSGAIDMIVQAIYLWRKRTSETLAAAAQQVQDNDNKYFPFKPLGFGGCDHTDYINGASMEASHDIMNSLLKLGEEGPSTKLTEAFGSDEPVGDQLQSLLMAAYQMALKDLATGNLNPMEVLRAMAELHLIDPKKLSKQIRTVIIEN